MTPYYEHAGITIYHGDCRDVLPTVVADVLVMDPPYGISHASGWENALEGIANDDDLSIRDHVLAWWDTRPALVFGTWKRSAPKGAHTCLIWDKGPASGMGDLSVPWKPNWEAIFVLGKGFRGTRDSSVLADYSLVTWNQCAFGRQHPNEKPESLLLTLLRKCPDGVVFDPCFGSGTVLTAAKRLGRAAIGIEIEERYCEIASQRLSQEVLDFGPVLA